MTKPLALVFYEKLLPGQQVLNRLQDLGYRVQSVTDASNLARQVEQHMPMLLIAELPKGRPAAVEALNAIKANPVIAHVAILAYVGEANAGAREAARAAGVDLVASESGVLDQLPHLLDQVLAID